MRSPLHVKGLAAGHLAYLALIRPALHAEHLVRSLAGPFGWSVYDKSR